MDMKIIVLIVLIIINWGCLVWLILKPKPVTHYRFMNNKIVIDPDVEKPTIMNATIIFRNNEESQRFFKEMYLEVKDQEVGIQMDWYFKKATE